MKTNTHFLPHLAQFFFKMKNVSDNGFREIQNTHFLNEGITMCLKIN